MGHRYSLLSFPKRADAKEARIRVIAIGYRNMRMGTASTMIWVSPTFPIRKEIPANSTQ